MNTFEILQEYNALMYLMCETDENGVLINDENVLNELLSNINQSKSNKLDSIQLIKLDLEAKSQALKDEETRLNERRKSFDKQAEKLKNLQELLLNGEKFDTGRFTFSFRKSESVKVPDECEAQSYPKEWIVTKYSFDKKAIKEALKNGIDYSDKGIEIVTNYSLQIK